MTDESPPQRNGLKIGLAVMAAAVVIGGICLFVEGQRWERRLLLANPDEIPAKADLMDAAVARGAGVYSNSCRSCHGLGGKGDPQHGAPAFTDADWLYGAGRPSEIERTVTYGIRASRPKTWNLASMPAYATAQPMAGLALEPLTPSDIRDVVAYMRKLGGDSHEESAAARGAAIFNTRGACYDCHGSDGAGDSAIGAPNLTDHVWLYGDGSEKAMFNSVAYGHEGVCPPWIARLTPVQIRAVSLYIQALSTSASGKN